VSSAALSRCLFEGFEGVGQPRIVGYPQRWFNRSLPEHRLTNPFDGLSIRSPRQTVDLEDVIGAVEKRWTSLDWAPATTGPGE
jgi:hypothetical protein